MPAASSVPARSAALLLVAAIAAAGCAAPANPSIGSASRAEAPASRAAASASHAAASAARATPCGVRTTEMGRSRTADSSATSIACAAPGDEPPRSQRVRPHPGQIDVTPIAWRTAHVGRDDRTVTLYFTSGVEPCSVLDHVQTSRKDDHVSITLFEGAAPDAGDVACIDIGVLKSVRLVLRHRLGARELVDGARS
jgi:hypothetical protein